MIQAGNPSKETERIELTPWDLKHLLVSYIQEGVLFHKPKPKADEPQNAIIHHLKTSLSRTLHFFPPLAGRLATLKHDDQTTSFFIDCNNAGALFVHAIAEQLQVSDLLEPVYVPEIIDAFFQFDGVKNIEGTSKPLLAVQVTELADGISIGCSINHSVVDGCSFWHFFNSWSEISRGFDYLSKLPLFNRPVIDDIDYPIRIPLKQEQIQEHSFQPDNLKLRVFYFTKQRIVRIKGKVNAEMKTNKISSLQALLSLFWQSIVRNRQSDPKQETMIFLVIGVRQKLQQVAEEYFGNAIQGAMVSLKVGELVGKGFGNAAWEINQIVGNQSEENLRKCFKSWVNRPLLFQGGAMMNNALLIANSPRFDIYGNDFGWGRPIAVNLGAEFKIDGLLTVSTGVEQGDIEIRVCLSVETFQAMENDEHFIAALNI
ncbi:HXXXD-type acyl-transferase family protein [Hibiscus syriacus]|uniref:HXXXD-type acyl-transferase family protein n=2 Tax=Hibiscus syriacus TaxID=106335 RepID=A0A6A3D283_HIBSY|nr:HXXXD-type acyl-transferase family protein [Hibiscus syriacus]